MERKKKVAGVLLLSIPALCLCAATFFAGWVVGLSLGIQTILIAAICGSVAWLTAIVCLWSWLESRARTALEARAMQDRAGSKPTEPTS